MHETEMGEKKKVSWARNESARFPKRWKWRETRTEAFLCFNATSFSSLSFLWCGKGDGVVGRPPTGSSAWRPAAGMGAARRAGRPWAWRPAAGAAPPWSQGRPRALLRRGCRGRPWAWRPAAVAAPPWSWGPAAGAAPPWAWRSAAGAASSWSRGPVASAAPPWAWKSDAGVAPPWSRRLATARLRTPPGRHSVLRREFVVHHDAIVLVYTERPVTGGKKKG